MARSGPAAAFALDGLSVLAVSLALLLIRTEGWPRRRTGATILRDVLEGVRYAARTPRIALILGPVVPVSLCAINHHGIVPLVAREASLTRARRPAILGREDAMSQEISIQFTRFSAFYSPLIATIAGGFLKDEGLEPRHSVAPLGKTAIEALVNGMAQVVQSAPSQGFGPLEKGQRPPAVHFAQINEKDGFFLTARRPDPAFTWDALRGKKVLVDHGGQPLAMFKYACHRRGLDYAAIQAIDVPSDRMDEAFRKGEGDYIHQQGPAPQQLEHDGVGHVVASVGDAIGPCAFSSLAATREWLGTDMALRFMRAYRKARAWLLETPAARVAEAEAGFFPEIDRAVLTATIAYYQKLGCWTPHVEITRPAWDVTLDVFQHSGLITRRHRYEDVVAPPPGAA